MEGISPAKNPPTNKNNNVEGGLLPKTLNVWSSWWFSNVSTHLKKYQSNWIISPGKGENKIKRNHHPVWRIHLCIYHKNQPNEVKIRHTLRIQSGFGYKSRNVPVFRQPKHATGKPSKIRSSRKPGVQTCGRLYVS